MKSFGLDAELMSRISPNKIAMYLEYKKWRKEKEASGIASLWSYIKNNKKISVLLPLDSDLSDFEIKIEELVTVLVHRTWFAAWVILRSNFSTYANLW